MRFPPRSSLLETDVCKAPDYKRAVGLPLFIGLGNIGGIVSSNLYPSSDAPRYRMGLSSEFCCQRVSTSDTLTCSSLLGLHSPSLGVRGRAVVFVHSSGQAKRKIAGRGQD